MPTLELANDVQIKTEAVPGTAPAVYFAIEWTAAAATGRASRVVVSGTVQSATETSVVTLRFQLRLQVFGSTNGIGWSPLGTAVSDLIATFVDASGTRSGAPNAFVSPAFSTAGFAWIRVRWMLYPISPATALAVDQSVVLTAQAGLERG